MTGTEIVKVFMKKKDVRVLKLVLLIGTDL